MITAQDLVFVCLFAVTYSVLDSLRVLIMKVNKVRLIKFPSALIEIKVARKPVAEIEHSV